jgi:peroxiredoxin Q/BCP
LLPVGSPVPDLELAGHSGKRYRLRELGGRPIVVYFYPKDHTAGCTVQAEEMREAWGDVERTDAFVFGVSTDDERSHQSFASDYELPFELVPDTDHRIAQAFGVPLSRGRAKRVTFVIDADGRVAQVFPEVRPRGSAQQVLAALGDVAR